jgi:hypothetical protein
MPTDLIIDVVAAVLLGFCAWRLAYLGLNVTIHPPGSRQGRTKKSLKREFVIIGCLSTLLVAIQVYRASGASSALMVEIGKNRNAAASLYSVEPSNRGQALIAGQLLQFNVHFMVRENTARNLRFAAQMFIVDSAPTVDVSRAVASQFKGTETQQLNFLGQDMGVNTGAWKTVSMPMSEKQIEDIMAGKSTIYVVTTVHWVNPSGSDGHSDGCTYLQTPIEKYLTLTNGVWHFCGI